MIKEEIRKINPERSDLRTFGLTAAVIFLVLGMLSWHHGKASFLYLLIFSVAFTFIGLLRPTLLKSIHRGWMTLAILMNLCMTTVILTAVFYLVLTPMGLLARLMGKTFLGGTASSGTSTYWKLKERRKLEKADYERQF
jgi:hypothetical protein